MTTLDKLTQLIDSLPADSVTRANLLAVRATLREGQHQERLLHAVLKAFSQERIRQLNHRERPRH